MARNQSARRRRGQVWREDNRVRVRVSAGIDKTTNKQIFLSEAVLFPPRPTDKQLRQAFKEAEAIRDRFIVQADKRKAA